MLVKKLVVGKHLSFTANSAKEFTKDAVVLQVLIAVVQVSEPVNLYFMKELELLRAHVVRKLVLVLLAPRQLVLFLGLVSH